MSDGLAQTGTSIWGHRVMLESMSAEPSGTVWHQMDFLSLLVVLTSTGPIHVVQVRPREAGRGQSHDPFVRPSFCSFPYLSSQRIHTNCQASRYERFIMITASLFKFEPGELGQHGQVLVESEGLTLPETTLLDASVSLTCSEERQSNE